MNWAQFSPAAGGNIISAETFHRLLHISGVSLHQTLLGKIQSDKNIGSTLPRKYISVSLISRAWKPVSILVASQHSLTIIFMPANFLPREVRVRNQSTLLTYAAFSLKTWVDEKVRPEFLKWSSQVRAGLHLKIVLYSKFSIAEEWTNTKSLKVFLDILNTWIKTNLTSGGFFLFFPKR